MTTYKSIKYNISGADLTGLTAGQIPNLDTAKITTGTLADARIAASNVTQHVVATDLTPVRQDVLTLALKQAVQENSTKFNLPNSAITKFEADADYDSSGSTTTARHASEYLFSATQTVGSNVWETETNSRTGTYTLTDTFASLLGLYSTSGTLSKMIDGSVPAANNGGAEYYLHAASNTASEGTHYMRWDIGAGNEKYFLGYKYWNQNNATQYGGTNNWKIQGSNDASSWTDLHTFTRTHSASAPTEHTWSNSTAYRYIQITPAGTLTTSTATWQREWIWGWGSLSTSVGATGTALGTTNVPTSAVTEVSGVMLLKHAYGTNTLGTDVKVYFTADNSNWTEVTSGDFTDAGTFSTGIKMIKMAKKTVTSGSDVRWKIVWANQSASSKEGHIYGIGLNY